MVERLLGFEEGTRGVRAGGAGEGTAGLLSALANRFDYMADYSAADTSEEGAEALRAAAADALGLASSDLYDADTR